ncbi:hypothetical protein R3P38DRAFT_3473628, partial [Favolaschia claudopus]
MTMHFILCFGTPSSIAERCPSSLHDGAPCLLPFGLRPVPHHRHSQYHVPIPDRLYLILIIYCPPPDTLHPHPYLHLYPLRLPGNTHCHTPHSPFNILRCSSYTVYHLLYMCLLILALLHPTLIFILSRRTFIYPYLMRRRIPVYSYPVRTRTSISIRCPSISILDAKASLSDVQTSLSRCESVSIRCTNISISMRKRLYPRCV